MSTTPSSPMWEGQRGFRSLAQADARESFGAVDARLEPKVALAGLRVEERDDLPEACVEPARFEHALGSLAAVRARVLATGGDHGPRPALADDRLSTAQMLRADDVAARMLVERSLAAFEPGSDVVTRCSLPQRVGAYLVFVVVQFDATAYAVHRGTAEAGRASVAADAAADGAVPGDAGRPDSLVDAVVEEFLSECSATLSRPDRGRYGVLDHEVPDLLRAAGRRLMHVPGRLMHGMTDLYDICNVVSTMRYEGAASAGAMLIVPPGRPGVHLHLALRQPTSLRDYRRVRKLLEISDGELKLLCADGEVFGFGTLAADASIPTASHYLIEFVGQHRWRLSHGRRTLMEVTYGQPHLPVQRLDPDAFRERVARTFPAMNGDELEALWQLVSAATQQHHGTMVVVSEGAEAEALRLGTQATPTEPTRLSPDLMRLVTAIDGAVLLDTTNRCHAIGAILDGLSTEAGDPARGARYNSAIRYVASSAHACVAIIVSEDGMIDVVANGG